MEDPIEDNVYKCLYIGNSEVSLKYFRNCYRRKSIHSKYVVEYFKELKLDINISEFDNTADVEISTKTRTYKYLAKCGNRKFFLIEISS